MKCAKIFEKGKVTVVETEIPQPGPGEVLIAMRASALCRSDLHRYHGKQLFDNEDDAQNFTPGHEPCGVVAKMGEGVTRVKPGDRVALYLGLGCGECEYCLRGDVNLCRKFECIGFARDGAHADYMVIPEYNCLPMPDDMDFITGALATDVGGTLYTACKRLGVRGGKTVVIFGMGPMGCGGVLMAKAYGGRVIAVDVDASRLDLAKELGADHIVNSRNVDALGEILALTGGNGADIAIDCSGNEKAENQALDCVKGHGSVGFIGESDKCTINISLQYIRKCTRVLGCWYFNRGDWPEIAAFIMGGNIPLNKICSHTFPIDDADEAFRLFDNHATQKVVFVWDGKVAK
jgi:Threonine dehydrogenase and related Zn-dependent dehydrogenases